MDSLFGNLVYRSKSLVLGGGFSFVPKAKTANKWEKGPKGGFGVHDLSTGDRAPKPQISQRILPPNPLFREVSGGSPLFWARRAEGRALRACKENNMMFPVAIRRNQR